MSMIFDPELREIINAQIPTIGSGGNLQSIGPGLYKFTLPDGREILMDENGNIIG